MKMKGKKKKKNQKRAWGALGPGTGIQSGEWGSAALRPPGLSPQDPPPRGHLGWLRALQPLSREATAPPGRALSQHSIWENLKSRSSLLWGCEVGGDSIILPLKLCSPSQPPAPFPSGCDRHDRRVPSRPRLQGTHLPGGFFLPHLPPGFTREVASETRPQSTGALCCLLGGPRGTS